MPTPTRSLFIGATACLALIVVYALLSMPAPDPPIPKGAAGEPFLWKQDETWKALEESFRHARRLAGTAAGERIEEGFRQGEDYLAALAASRRGPDAPIFDELEDHIFRLGALVAAHPGSLAPYIDLVMRTRSLLKLQSESWDMTDRTARDRLYRLLYGGRAALEEVMLQAPADSYPALIPADHVPSVTPAFVFSDLPWHSGDILVSRGGAPTSALIARGNDYPANFSHAALLYVDETTGEPAIIESHIDRGVAISTVDAYITDTKLRIMVLRLRPDLANMQADPHLPHKAAKQAYDQAKASHIPYDFAMDHADPSRQFCSEVVSSAYRPLGIELWQGTSRISSPGVVRWLSYFGVTHFETQAPADLEYDPALRVVAEWRDPETLWQDHVDNAVVQAMLQGAEEGDSIPYARRNLALARLAKAYSAVRNQFGAMGPVPEGMSATAALRNLGLADRHQTLKHQVLAQADTFRQQHGYPAPFWELVRLANQARIEHRTPDATTNTARPGFP